MINSRRLEQLPKYIYKPILEKIKEAYLANAEMEYVTSVDVESNVRLVIEADSQELADNSRIGFVDIRMWELDETL
jgi:hypothetical protein